MVSLMSDLELRKRRKAFYLRNGYRETGYRMKLNGVEQEIIVANGEFVKKKFRFALLFIIMVLCGQRFGNRKVSEKSMNIIWTNLYFDFI